MIASGSSDGCDYMSVIMMFYPGGGKSSMGRPFEAMDPRRRLSSGSLSWLGCVCRKVFLQPGRPSSVYVAPVNRVRG